MLARRPIPSEPRPGPARACWPGALALLALAPMLFACQPKIGDPCRRSIDCGLQVVRQCDVSNAGRDPEGQGECTLENCSYGVCPREAVCVKVYASQFTSIACEPATEDMPEGTDDCTPNEVCLPEGLCGDELRARTSCRFECESDGDCRSNYHCITTGSDGLYVAPDPANPTSSRSAKICVPK